MKPATLAARHTIEREHAIKVKPRLIAEWEYNRFLAPTVTVTPDQSGDTEWGQFYGNLSSMVQPNRPVAGIAKARADDSVIPLESLWSGPAQTRYYPSSDYDLYMYWSSLQRSELTTQADGSYPFDTPIVLTSIYPQAIAVNKLVVGFELGYCKPKNTSIQVTTDGTTWTTIADNPAIDGNGQATIWRGQFGWSDTPDYDWPIAITGVRLNVYSVDSPFSHLDVLQISPRLENDLSDFIVNYESDFEVDSPSFIAPLGKASSNTATVTLSNIDGRFNNDNVNSLYYGMIEKKVRFTMDLGLDTSNQGGTPGTYEYIREFTMWTDSWGAGDTSSNVSVTLKDSSVILQEHNMPAIFLENMTVGGIVGYIMDRIGLSNYVYTRSEAELGQTIPFYWPSDTNENSNPRWGRLMVSTTPAPNTTIWDELSALAESTQTALYFDQNDQLQIVARKAMYNNNKPVNWNLDAVPNGLKLPDVVKASSNFDLTTNQVEVTYRPCAMSSDANGFPIMATVWQPTAPTDNSTVPTFTDSSNATDIVLRAGVLTKDLLKTSTDMWMSQTTAIIWPFESDVNIEGEMLHYKGKEYAYYDANNVLQKAFVSTLTDQQKYDALNDDLHWKNAYTGRFSVTARGLYGTYAADHKVSKDAYTALLTSYDNQVFSALGDGYITQHDGYITQFNAVTTSSHDYQHTYMLRKHTSAVEPVINSKGDSTVWYGAKIRFPSGYVADPTATTTNGAQFFVPAQSPSTPTNPANPNDKPDMATATANYHVGGLFFAGDWGDAGYYLEIRSTGQVDGWEQRVRNEISLVAMPGNAAAVRLKGTNQNDASGKNDANGNPLKIGNMGFQVGILEDQWYQIDVSYTERASDGHSLIGVYVNGVVAGTWDLIPYRSDATTDIEQKTPANMTNQWRFGTHVLGPSMGMDVEYLYAVTEDETRPWLNPDQTSFLDIVTGSFSSGFVYKNIKYSFQNVNPTYKWPSGAIYSIPELTNESRMILDEYGPVVHEVRLFDVNFDTSTVPAPASFIYVTNPQVQVLSYLSDAFGAEFMLANASRDNVIVNGEDDITAGSANPITQSILIYGRSVYTAQNDQYLVKKDDDAIRRQGLIRTQITSRYVQTDEMATDLGNWILSLWASGVDEVDCDLFGNPLLQVGDLVTMNYPVQGMAPSTHQYFVTSIINNFDGGYKTSVKLRRAKIDGSVSGSLDG